MSDIENFKRLLTSQNFEVDIFYFLFIFEFLQNLKFIQNGQHSCVFSCSHKFLYDGNTVCVKVKKQGNKMEEFLCEYEVGRFFRKFDLFFKKLYFLILVKAILSLIILINLKTMRMHILFLSILMGLCDFFL
jgi:hypothetical protein